MKKKIIFLLIVLMSICVVSHASAVDDVNGTEIAVTEEIALSEDNVHQFNGEDYNFDNIQSTFESANDGDKIYFNGTFVFDREISVKKSVTIEGIGEGATITLDDYQTVNSRFFNIESTASNVILNNLKFQSGIKNDGGAILWQGDNGVIKNCVFNTNHASDNGGAVFLSGNNCNITNCTFTNNHADYGGAIFISGSGNSITSSKFDNNYCGLAGGAIFSDCNNLKIDYCNFTNNRAPYCGGAVAVNANKGNILHSLFKNNKVEGSDSKGGGAIYSDGESLIIDDCTFNKNSASYSNGGAVILGESNTVKYSSFANNSAVLGNDIYTNVSSSSVMANNFIIGYNETENDAVYGISESDLINFNNNFTVIKVKSTVSFSAGIIFEYGSTSNPILVTAEGGKITKATIKVLNHPEAKVSYLNNQLTVSNLAVGKYVMRITTIPDENHYSTYCDIDITVNKATAAITASSISVVLKKSSYWKITLVNSKTGKPINGMKLTLKVYTGKKYKKVTVKTNSKGVASFKTSNLAKGKHKMVVSGSHDGYKFNTVTSYVTVVKPIALKFKVEQVKNTKTGSLISFKVTNKKTKKGVNGIKVKFMIKVGKKYKKMIVLKTKKVEKANGIAGVFTNEYSAGKHAIIVKPVSIKYSGSGKSAINIKKSAKSSKYSKKTVTV